MGKDLNPYPVLAVALHEGAEGFGDDYDVLGTCRAYGFVWVLVEVERGVDLPDDARVCMYCDATIYDDEVPGSLPVDCPNGVVAFVKLG